MIQIPASILVSLPLLLASTSFAQTVVYSNDFESSGFTGSFGDGTVSTSLGPTAGVGSSQAAILDVDFSTDPDPSFYQASGQIFIAGSTLGNGFSAAGATSADQVTISFDISASSALSFRFSLQSIEPSPTGTVGRWEFDNINLVAADTFQTVSLNLGDATVVGSPILSSVSHQPQFTIGSTPELGSWPQEAGHQLRVDNLQITAIPEPGMAALFTSLGMVAFTIAYRRR